MNDTAVEKKSQEIGTPENAKFCLSDEVGFVALIDGYGDDTSVVNAARVSFGKKVTKISDKEERLIRFLLEHEHGSPLEHNSLTFLVKCPLFVARQWHRHRIGISINEISGRYTEMKEEFYVPKNFRQQSQSNRQASVEGSFSETEQEKLTGIFEESIKKSYEAYQELLELGVAREQARAVLPLSLYTQYYWTCNLRSLFHFVRLRDHNDAQHEMRQYASSMLDQAREFFPVCVKVWEELGRP